MSIYALKHMEDTISFVWDFQYIDENVRVKSI